MIFRLAWRNTWRNSRRTLITMASVFFAVLLSTLMMSMKEGVYGGMMDAMINTYAGYGQVHARGYWEEKTPEQSFEVRPALLDSVRQTRGIRLVLPRLEGVALAASDSVTRVTVLAGLDLAAERSANRLHERVSQGHFPEAGERGVLLGAGLASVLRLAAGDTVVLLGQGYHGAPAAGKYPVRGLVHFGSPELSRQLVILSLGEAQEFFGMEGRINNLVLHFDEPQRATPVLQQLRKTLGPDFEVMGWKELLPGLDNMIRTDRMEGYIFMLILYMVVSFGIFGTILMMFADRMHEFGVLVSLGMKRGLLALVVFLETVLIALAGATAGMLASYPVCYYFHSHPIALGGDLKKMTEEYGLEAVLRASVEPFVFIQQAVVILVIACLLSCYPYIKLLRLQPTVAMRK